MMSLVTGTELVALVPFEGSVRSKILLDAIPTYRPALRQVPNFADPCEPATYDRSTTSRIGRDFDEARRLLRDGRDIFAVKQTSLGRPVDALDVDADVLSQGMMMRSPKVGARVRFLLSCGTPTSSVQILVWDADCSESLA